MRHILLFLESYKQGKTWRTKISQCYAFSAPFLKMAESKLDRKYGAQVLITNPDGSVDQGVLADYKSETSEASQMMGPAELLDDEVVTEVVDIYLKHKRSFCTLLTIQLMVEVVFTVLEVVYAKSAMRDIEEVYSSLGSENVTILYWAAAGIALGYEFIYYPVGFYAAKTKRLAWLEWFSYLAVGGVVAQMLTAYLHKFNLLVFFLRLVAYVYARFLISLIKGILLLPRSILA